ncbi:MAG: DsbA family protein [Candidatus Komeilibacteria bacterium]|nr:DsbA family protein [Candidatus Komeilibacteria bacterium]
METPINNLNKIPILSGKRSWYKRWWGMIIILILAYLIVTNLLLWLSPKSPAEQGQLSNGPSANQVSEEQLYLNAADDPAMGDKNAKVRIVEFSDFQCPYCRESFPVVREILDRYGDKIYFVYRDFPVSTIHPESVKAAEAGQCAHEQGKFWQMHDKIFINQENIQPADLKNYARAIGLNTDQFNNCLDSGQYQAEVNQDFQDGVNLGAVATPTFFINGYRVSGSIPLEIFIKLIDQGLSQG